MKRLLAVVLSVFLSMAMVSPAMALEADGSGTAIKTTTPLVTVSSISITKYPKRAYYQYLDTQFSYTGLTVSVTYSDSTTTTLAYGSTDTYGNTISVTPNMDFTSSAADSTYVFDVSVGGASASYTVVYKLFSTASVTALTLGKQYSVSAGNYLDGKAYSFTAPSDGSVLLTTSAGVGYAVYDTAMGKKYYITDAGTQKLDLTAGKKYYLITSPLSATDQTAYSFTCRKTSLVKSVSVKTKPSKTNYIAGTDTAVDFSGAVLTVVYADGFSEDVGIDSSSVYGINAIVKPSFSYDAAGMVKPGTYPVTILFGGATTSENVTFAAPSTAATGESLVLDSQKNIEVQPNSGKTYSFTPTESGIYRVTLANNLTDTDNLTVYYTDASGNSKKFPLSTENLAVLKAGTAYYVTFAAGNNERDVYATINKVGTSTYNDTSISSIYDKGQYAVFELPSTTSAISKALTVSGTGKSDIALLDEDGNILAQYSSGSSSWSKNIAYASKSGTQYYLAVLALADGNTISENPVSLSSTSMALSTSVYTYSGAAKKPSVTVTCEGKALSSGSGYTLKYADNMKVGKASVTVTGTGSLTGSKTLYYKINPAKVTKLKLKSAKKAIKASWGKRSEAGGYEVYVSKKKSSGYSKKATLTSASKLTVTVSKLKANTKYYVKVRAYKTVKGTKYYGAYSTPISIKTKK